MADAISKQFMECCDTQYLLFSAGLPYIRPNSRSRAAEPTESTRTWELGTGDVGGALGVVVGAATTFTTTLRPVWPSPLVRAVTPARASETRLAAPSAEADGAADFTLAAGSDEAVDPGCDVRERSRFTVGLDGDV